MAHLEQADQSPQIVRPGTPYSGYFENNDSLVGSEIRDVVRFHTGITIYDTSGQPRGAQLSGGRKIVENSLDAIGLGPDDYFMRVDESAEGHISFRLPGGEHRSMDFRAFVGSFGYYIDPELFTKEQAESAGEDVKRFPKSKYWVRGKDNNMRPLLADDRILLTTPTLPQPIQTE